MIWSEHFVIILPKKDITGIYSAVGVSTMMSRDFFVDVDDRRTEMKRVWIVHLENKKDSESTILACFTTEKEANALHDILEKLPVETVKFFVDDFPLTGRFEEDADVEKRG
jgi:hypothetical protein